MTNEQREAIELLERIHASYFLSGMIEQSNYIVDKAYETDKAIDTVLSLIKEQQEEIEGLKDKEVLIKRYFKKCDLIKQKDKQIDLMTDFMYKTGTGRRTLSCMVRQNDECNENGCRYCIKQYFADKAKGQ